VAHDVFISYSSKDKPVADAVCAAVEAHGVRCWIAPRDVMAGKPYGEALIEAINSARALVLVFSANANQSTHIAKEVERAVSKGIPIVPFRIQDVMPSKSLDYFIGSVHWLDAMTPPLESHLTQLAQSVRALLAVDSSRPSGTSWTARARLMQHPAPPAAAKVESSPVPASKVETSPPPASSPRKISRAKLIGITGGAVILLAGATGALLLINRGLDPVSKAMVGTWTWNSIAPVAFERDGTFHSGAFEGTWRVADRDGRRVEVTWPAAVDRVTLSRDGSGLNGANQYGVKLTARRMSGSRGGVQGTWSWWNGAVVIIADNGTITAGPFLGRWIAVPGEDRTFTFTWPPPIDALKLSSDGTRLEGGNQYGFPTAATRQ